MGVSEDIIAVYTNNFDMLRSDMDETIARAVAMFILTLNLQTRYGCFVNFLDFTTAIYLSMLSMHDALNVVGLTCQGRALIIVIGVANTIGLSANFNNLCIIGINKKHHTLYVHCLCSLPLQFDIAEKSSELSLLKQTKNLSCESNVVDDFITAKLSQCNTHLFRK